MKIARLSLRDCLECCMNVWRDCNGRVIIFRKLTFHACISTVIKALSHVKHVDNNQVDSKIGWQDNGRK